MKRLGVLLPAAAAVLLATAVHHAGAARDPAVSFAERGGALVVTGRTYRLTLSRRNGKVLSLDDGASGTRLVHGSDRCLWGTIAHNDTSYLGGCSFAPSGRRRFSYRWNAAAAALVLTYRSQDFGVATATLHAGPDLLDLRLAIARARGGKVRTRVQFPAGLAGDARTVAAGYAPNVLPGVRLQPAYFGRVGNTVEIYPSRWAFADYLALDVARAHLSLYSVSRGPIFPAQLGFLHTRSPAPCSGTDFCIVHEYQTWIRPGQSWRSPVVRVRVGPTPEQSTLAYRRDNGLDAYPSLQSKLGGRLDTLARAPLLKANLPLLRPFRAWGAELAALPSPLLLHPVGFQVGGHDENDPDFLPSDPRFGGDADFGAMIAAAHARGDLVMPYGNLSWWDPVSPTMRSLPAPLGTKDVAVLDEHGAAATVAYGPHTGVIVSPYAPFVRQRVAQYMQDWRTRVPADCLFLDQVGARPWLRDFNPRSPTPEAYDDGWLALLAPYRDRCLMVEDGWDRLARDSVGFHGSLLMMSRELDLPNTLYGAGNWEPYPLATWLFHDKVLLYQHDLFDGTMAADDEVLTWNMAFGLVGSYSWDALAPGANPWLDLVAALQRDFGPHYAGVRLSGYRALAPAVNESTFGDLEVIANLDGARSYTDAGSDVAPHGFLARTRDGALLAGIFDGRFDGVALSSGTHHVLVERGPAGVTVRQPVGADTELGVEVAATAQPLVATALGTDGANVGTVGGSLQGGRFVFRYARELNGRAVSAYRIAPG